MRSTGIASAPTTPRTRRCRELLLHNMREEMEHASMLLEWIRRADSDFDRFLKTYLFTEGLDPRGREGREAASGGGDSAKAAPSRAACRGGFTIGSLKGT